MGECVGLAPVYRIYLLCGISSLSYLYDMMDSTLDAVSLRTLCGVSCIFM